MIIKFDPEWLAAEAARQRESSNISLRIAVALELILEELLKRPVLGVAVQQVGKVIVAGGVLPSVKGK